MVYVVIHNELTYLLNQTISIENHCGWLRLTMDHGFMDERDHMYLSFLFDTFHLSSEQEGQGPSWGCWYTRTEIKTLRLLPLFGYQKADSRHIQKYRYTHPVQEGLPCEVRRQSRANHTGKCCQRIPIKQCRQITHSETQNRQALSTQGFNLLYYLML